MNDYTSLPAIEMMKHLLAGYDKGLLMASEVEHRILGALLKPHMDCIAKGEESTLCSSWCGADPPPTIRAVLELDAQCISFKPYLECKASDESGLLTANSVAQVPTFRG